MEEKMLRRTWAEIDLDALAHNYETLRKHTGAPLVGVVKADAYGHGAITLSRELEKLGVRYLAVSNLEEAKELRKAGIQAPILILGYTPPEYVDQLIEHRITQAAAGERAAIAYSEAAQKCGGTLKIHIKVDTGMSRLGFPCTNDRFDEGVAAARRACALPNLEAEGIFTHFAVSDEPENGDCKAFTLGQYDLFCRFFAAVEEGGHRFALHHCANSGASAFYPEMALDMVRPGILLYGCGNGAVQLGLRPVMTLKTTVSDIRPLEEGRTVSYGRTYKVESPARMGVLPIGYADGFFRALSNRCKMFVKGDFVPQRGRICMDMCMIDLSDRPDVQVGDEVEIFGPRQRVDILAETVETIPYELTCAVSKRVPRLFFKDGKQVGSELRMYL